MLIEAETYRHMGHHVNDPGLYMPSDRLAHCKSRDPVEIAAGQVLEMDPSAAVELDDIRSAVDAEIEAAVAFAVDSPAPSPQQFVRETEGY